MTSTSTMITQQVQVDSLQDRELPERLHSIDVFRALTMFLMIFVNDLWTLQGIPGWLEHKPADVDGLGLADVVFPAFLLIVGLSIPYAISNRLKKGDSNSTIVTHLFLRSFALIVIGVFHVNLEYYNPDAMLSKSVWQIFITVGFFLVWLDYPKEAPMQPDFIKKNEKLQSILSGLKLQDTFSAKIAKAKKYTLQGLGIIILAAMAMVYTGGTPENPVWMKFHWWGILGLIGWAYLTGSLIFMFFRNSPEALLGAFFFFLLFSCSSKLGWLEPLSFIRHYVWFVGDGAMATFVLAGIISSVYYKKITGTGKSKDFWVLLGTFAVVMIAFGLQTRPLWGIHKIGDSPSWITICIGLSLITFGALIWLVDMKDKKEWFKILKPAGTSTLTCYLLPYIHYAIFSIVGISLPMFMRTGMVGIAKSLAYAFIIILITGLLEKWKLRLKI